METASNENMQLYEKLVTLQHLLMRQRFVRKGSGPIADPLRGQGRILALLKIKDGVSTKDMTSVLGIRTSSLNELLSKLEAKDYIMREQSEEDGRVMMVKLTDKGRAVEQPSGAAGTADMFDCLDEDEKKAFGDYLDRVIAHVGAEISGRGDEGFEAMLRKREKAFKKFFDDGDRFDGPMGFSPFAAFGFHGACGGFDSHEGGRRGRSHRANDFGQE